VLALAGAPLVHAQNGTEADVKAAFLLNFAKFVEWPAEVMASNGPITACVVGSPTVASALVRAMQGRSISGHDVVVSNVTLDGPLRACHLLYVSGIDGRLARQIVQVVTGAAVFTVSDFDRFAALGGVPNLYVEDRRLRFAINVEAAHRARLRISSRLLALATLTNDE